MRFRKTMAMACLATLCLATGCSSLRFLAPFDQYWGMPAPPSTQAQAYTHYLAGVFHDKRGNLDYAVLSWNQAVRLDPQAVAPRVRLIRACLRQGDYETALKLCSEALAQAPQYGELWIVLGELNHRVGNYDAAVTAFKKAIELRPNDLIGYSALVELQESTNDLVAAIEIYEKLIERSPESAALHYQLGINLLRINDLENALQAFTTVLRLEPRVTRARFLRGLVFFDLGQYPESEEDFRLYLLEHPDDETAMEFRAGALAQMNRLVEAAKQFDTIFEKGLAVSNHHLQYAWLSFLMNKSEQAQRHALEGEAYLLAELLELLAVSDDTASSEKIVAWEGRYSLDEVDEEISQLTRAVFRLFGNEKSGEHFLRILDALQAPHLLSPVLTFIRARVLMQLEEYAGAQLELMKILLSGIQSKPILYHLAHICEKNGQYEEAEQYLRQCLAMDPDDPEILNFLGYLLADRNIHLEEAEILIQRALKRDPENPYYLDSLGWVFFRQGRLEEAAGLVRRAIYGMETDDAVLRDHLGDIYYKQGKTNEALSEWRRALRLDPSMRLVGEKIQKALPAQAP